MAKAIKKKTPAKRSSKPAKPGGKPGGLIDISIPGAETKKIPAKKQRT